MKEKTYLKKFNSVLQNHENIHNAKAGVENRGYDPFPLPHRREYLKMFCDWLGRKQREMDCIIRVRTEIVGEVAFVSLKYPTE